MTRCSCGPDWNVPLWGHWYTCPVARQASASIARIEQAEDRDREDARKRRGRISGQLVDGDTVPADERGAKR